MTIAEKQTAGEEILDNNNIIDDHSSPEQAWSSAEECGDMNHDQLVTGSQVCKMWNCVDLGLLLHTQDDWCGGGTKQWSGELLHLSNLFLETTPAPAIIRTLLINDKIAVVS